MAADGKDNDKTQSYSVLTPGTMVGHYRIIGRIGAGGMGEVYLAEDPGLNRKVALKFLPVELCTDDECRERFMREAQAAASLSHPNIITIHEVSEYINRPYFAMEYIEGDPLNKYVRDKQLSATDIIHLVIPIAQGLHKAHQQGIVHRDIKPSNIQVDHDGRPHILDFGLATVAGGEKLTQQGSTLGTIAYMSPEQVQGQAADQRSDLYSLGATFYELVAGQAPFKRGNTAATLQAVLNEAPDTLSHLQPGIPDLLQQVIARLLAKDPLQRYQSAGELVTDLKVLIGASDSGSLSILTSGVVTGPKPHRKRRLVLLASVLGALALVILLAGPLRNLWLPGSDAVAAENVLAVLHFDNVEDPEDSQRYGQILQELLITDLSGLPSIKVVSSQRLFDIQKQLGYADRAKIDKTIATEVAKKADAKTTLSGTLMQLSERWILTGQLISVADGTVINSHRIEGSDLYTMVDDLSAQVQRELSATGQYFAGGDSPIREKTTTSMDAYRHYLAGADLLGEMEYELAVEEFKKAIGLAPDFNQAYYKMGIAQWWLADVESGRGQESLRKILEDKRYTTERERLLAEGALALTERRFGDALVHYRKLTEDYPDEKEAWYGLGEALYHGFGTSRTEALHAFETAISLDMTFVLAYRHIFDVLFGNHEFETAYARAENLIKIKPDAPAGYRYLLSAVIAMGDTMQAALALEQALQHHQTDEEQRRLFVDLTRTYESVNDYQKAEYYARRALSLDPDSTDSRVLLYLGRALYRQGNLVDAKILGARLLELNPDDIEALTGLFNISTQEYDFPKAIEYARKTVELDPQNSDYWGMLIQCHEQINQTTLADSVLDVGLETIQSRGGRLDLISNIAQFYSNTGLRKNRAEELLARGREMDASGTNQRLWTVSAQVALNQRRYNDAEQFARQALAICGEDCDDDWSYNVLYESYVYSKRYDQAQAAAQRTIDRHPRHPAAYAQLLEAFVYSGRDNEADSILNIILTLAPAANERAQIFYNIAIFYRNAGRIEQALRLTRQAYDLTMKQPWILERIAKLQEILGEFQEAEKTYRSILQENPDRRQTLQQLSGLFIRRKQFSNAEQWLKKVSENEQGHPGILRSYGYLYSAQQRYADALPYASQAVEKDDSFFGTNLLAWILVAGDIDIERGLALATKAIGNPPAGSHFDRYVLESPYVPLPHHTLGLGYMKTGDYSRAEEYLADAARLRPDDENIARDLQRCREMTP